MRWRNIAIACGLLMLLAGCTTLPQRPVTSSPVSSAPAPIATPHISAPRIPTPTITPASGPWARLRASFAMNDCVAPTVRRAHWDTRNPRHFEAHLKALLPLINYVQHVAAQAHVAGEFVLLPWVESHFHEIPSHHRHRAAGMWQVMPATARVINLSIGRVYDGRLDAIASTHAVMRMLARYYHKWHDWRLADLAYNAGQYRVRRLVRAHGVPPAKPVIPDVPIGRSTLHHLTKLLAIACVIRDPKRFHVRLPTWNPADRLEVVKLHVPTRLRQIAHLSGLPIGKLRKLNAGYRLASVTTAAPMHLLLPAQAALSLREAIAAGALHAAAGLASINAPITYTVTSGDSLWGIAHRFDLQVGQLQQWNGLDSSVLHPGETLQLEPSPTG